MNNRNFARKLLSNKYDQCKIQQNGLETIYSKKLIIEFFKKQILSEFWDEIDTYPRREVAKLARKYFKALQIAVSIERALYGVAPNIGK